MKVKILFVMIVLLIYDADAQDISVLKNQKPFEIKGALEMRTMVYNAKGIQNRRSPFTYIFSGSPNISLYGISIPISFTLSEQERKFKQPFNQLGLSPTYKWATIHAGYRNLNFSPYTLAGHTLLGAGIELKPGKFYIAVISGRLNRTAAVDSTTGIIQPTSFSRYGTAVKIGLGSNKNMANISILSAKDSEKGLHEKPDSSLLKPAANTVLGAEVRSFISENFFLEADGGLSIFTGDINAEFETDSSSRVLEFAKKILNLNATSKYFIGFSGSIGYKSKDLQLVLKYKQVDPNFISMGAYFSQNDLRNLTINPSFNALKGKLRLSGNLGVQEDNLKKLKEATTRRIIGLGSLSWNITDFTGIDIHYSNYSTNTEPVVALIENKYLLAQSNSNLSITPRIILPGQNLTHVILLSYNQNTLNDLNTDSPERNNIKSAIAGLNYSLSFNKTGLNLNTALVKNSNKMMLGEINSRGLTIGISKPFMKNKLAAGINSNTVLNTNLDSNGTIININGNLSYTPVNAHRLNLRMIFTQNKTQRDNDGESSKFTETLAELGYSIRF